ncbi:MAG: NAD(P)-dependent glycerol-3-phosphate dehydrogenase [Deltaproteobacteria bacterium]|nr:NAD(P)-dependent glycerol-3-phosphate dehydrogenase [Deltaproteobacteria bacterium]
MNGGIGVIGGGSWGTALANLLALKGYPVTLWVYEPELAAALASDRENRVYLPGIPLAANLNLTNDLTAAAAAKEVVVMAPPSQRLRKLLIQIRSCLASETLLVSASKGIENDTLMTMSQVIAETLPEEVAANATFLSGPTFAREVAGRFPAAAVAASRREETARRIQDLFSTHYFRVYTHTDVRGVELGGALKNVMALACGISDGLGLGDNARAALITRGLAEISRLGVALGALPATFAGLAGMGDLVLTCTGALSRNRQVGLELGRGRSLDDILGSVKTVAEGVKTTLSAYQLGRRIGVETPIIEQVYRVLYERKEPKAALVDLMERALKSEREENG